jgi:hypothetical protein
VQQRVSGIACRVCNGVRGRVKKGVQRAPFTPRGRGGLVGWGRQPLWGFWRGLPRAPWPSRTSRALFDAESDLTLSHQNIASSFPGSRRFPSQGPFSLRILRALFRRRV